MRWDLKFKTMGSNFVYIDRSTLTANPEAYLSALWLAGGNLFFVVTTGRFGKYHASQIRNLQELQKALSYGHWRYDVLGFYQVYQL
jgi:hypothetical protein